MRAARGDLMGIYCLPNNSWDSFEWLNVFYTGYDVNLGTLTLLENEKVYMAVAENEILCFQTVYQFKLLCC